MRAKVLRQSPHNQTQKEQPMTREHSPQAVPMRAKFLRNSQPSAPAPTCTAGQKDSSSSGLAVGPTAERSMATAVHIQQVWQLRSCSRQRHTQTSNRPVERWSTHQEDLESLHLGLQAAPKHGDVVVVPPALLGVSGVSGGRARVDLSRRRRGGGWWWALGSAPSGASQPTLPTPLALSLAHLGCHLIW